MCVNELQSAVSSSSAAVRHCGAPEYNPAGPDVSRRDWLYRCSEQATARTIRGSKPGRGNRFVSPPKGTDRLWVPPSLFPSSIRRVERPGFEVDPHLHLVQWGYLYCHVRLCLSFCSSWTTWPWNRRHYGPPKRRENTSNYMLSHLGRSESSFTQLDEKFCVLFGKIRFITVFTEALQHEYRLVPPKRPAVINTTMHCRKLLVSWHDQGACCRGTVHTASGGLTS
jgi:hypothetical protein